MIKKDTFDKEKFKKELESNVRMLFRRKLEEATPQQIYQAVAYSVKDDIIDNWIETHKAYEKQDKKMVYYMSMEFLMGRALGNNMINLPLQHWATAHTAAESVTVMVCSNRKLRTVIR